MICLRARCAHLARRLVLCFYIGRPNLSSKLVLWSACYIHTTQDRPVIISARPTCRRYGDVPDSFQTPVVTTLIDYLHLWRGLEDYVTETRILQLGCLLRASAWFNSIGFTRPAWFQYAMLTAHNCFVSMFSESQANTQHERDALCIALPDHVASCYTRGRVLPSFAVISPRTRISTR